LINTDFNFKEGDVIKLDVGIHINGAIGDTASTIDLGDNSKLIKASRNALNAALDITKPGTTLNDIGAVIEDEITKLKFKPIKNLGGHGLDKWQIHTFPSVPNFANGDQTKLTKGQIIAIEPFASNGEGMIYESKTSEIYQLVKQKNVRLSAGREIFKFVSKKYKTLPFAKRHLVKDFNVLKLSMGLLSLKKEGILHEFGILSEKRKNSLISQAEHTVIVGEKITTKI
jgi:methionyl aminopeptidase